MLSKEFKRTYGHRGNDYRVATLTISFLNVIGIIIKLDYMSKLTDEPTLIIEKLWFSKTMVLPFSDLIIKS